MALVRKFEPKHRDRCSLHDEIEASYFICEKDGRKLLQIDMYGRESRENPGKQSQVLQLDQIGATELFRILKTEFGLE